MVYKLCHILKNMEKLSKIEYEILYLISKGSTNLKNLLELISSKPEIIIKKLEELKLLNLTYEGEEIKEFTLSQIGNETIKSATYRRWFNKLGR